MKSARWQLTRYLANLAHDICVTRYPTVAGRERAMLCKYDNLYSMVHMVQTSSRYTGAWPTTSSKGKGQTFSLFSALCLRSRESVHACRRACSRSLMTVCLSGRLMTDAIILQLKLSLDWVDLCLMSLQNVVSTILFKSSWIREEQAGFR